VQSVVSDRANGIDTSVAVFDAKDFYIGSDLERPEYVKVPIAHIPASVIQDYNLTPFITDKHILFQINKCLWGLPQSGYLSQCNLFQLLETNGYHEDLVIPCLFTNAAKTITMMITTDDFMVKSHDPAALVHLKSVLDSQYMMKADYGERGYYNYLGFRIQFYDRQKKAGLSMPTYWAQAFALLDPEDRIRPASTPAIYHPFVISSKAQLPVQADTSPLLDAAGIKRVETIIGYSLYYARAIDATFLTASNYYSSAQSNPTQSVLDGAERLLAYAKGHPTATLELHACDMQHHCQTDASLNSRLNGTSVAGDFHFFGNRNDPDTLNGPVDCQSAPIPTVCISTGEAEYAAASMAARRGIYIRQIAEALGYPQQTSSIICDNQVAVGIADETIKLHRTKGIDMRYHSLRQLVRDCVYTPFWRKGETNVADFFTKFLPRSVHIIKEPLILGHRSTFSHEATV
jgi:hypothetical protein